MLRYVVLMAGVLFFVGCGEDPADTQPAATDATATAGGNMALGKGLTAPIAPCAVTSSGRCA